MNVEREMQNQRVLFFFCDVVVCHCQTFKDIKSQYKVYKQCEKNAVDNLTNGMISVAPCTIECEDGHSNETEICYYDQKRTCSEE